MVKMEDVLSLYEQPAQAGRVRLCFDERPCQLLDEMVTPLPIKPDQPARIDNEYIRKGTAVVLLADDLDKGLRYCQVRQQRTKADYAQFMQWLVSTYHSTAEAVDLVQDNLNTHTYGAFYKHLPLAQARALQQKVRFHFTLKHGSWLNMAEPGGLSHRVFGLSASVSEPTDWEFVGTGSSGELVASGAGPRAKFIGVLR